MWRPIYVYSLNDDPRFMASYDSSPSTMTGPNYGVKLDSRRIFIELFETKPDDPNKVWRRDSLPDSPEFRSPEEAEAECKRRNARPN
jgi:hypothetical protein